MKILFNMTFSIIFIILHLLSLACSSIRFDKRRPGSSAAELLIPILGFISAVLFACATGPTLTYIAFMGLFCTSAVKIAPALVRRDIPISSLWDKITKYTLIANGVIELILTIVVSQIFL
jgi:hypothetical protein